MGAATRTMSRGRTIGLFVGLGLAGIIGVALCFAVGGVVLLGIRTLRSRPWSPPTPAAASPSG